MIEKMFSSKFKKRERTQNWAYEEKKLLLELCRKDMHIIENKRLDSALTSLKSRAWKIIHQQFAMTFGTDRNCNRLKEQWRRMKACTRAEILDYQHRISKLGQEAADKKKPSQFTFEIWEFMQDAKKVLEENVSETEMFHNNNSEESNSSQWGRASQNICEVQLNEDSAQDDDQPEEKKQRTLDTLISLEDITSCHSAGTSATNYDILNYIKSQYLNVNENFHRMNKSENSSDQLINSKKIEDDFKQKEQRMKLEILELELETAKINRDIAQINKKIISKSLNEQAQ